LARAMGRADVGLIPLPFVRSAELTNASTGSKDVIFNK
jgi:hypothetical protein